MLPGQKYTPEEVVGVLRRRFWAFAVPFALVAAAGAVHVYRMPNRYQAQALILFVPQRIPERLVARGVTQRPDDRINAMKGEVLSSTSLEGLIKQFDLYPGARRAGLMEDAIERMRMFDITTSIRGDSFTVSYAGSNPRVVKQVTDAVAAKFITHSTQDRFTLVETTTDYFDTQIAAVLQKLKEKEKALTEYQARFAGQLPTQEAATMAALANTRTEVRALTDSNRQAADQRVTLVRSLAFWETMTVPVTAPAGAGGVAGTTGVVPGRSAAASLADARKSLETMRTVSGLGDGHPQVRAMQQYIAQLEAQVSNERLEGPVSAAAQPVSPAEQTRLKNIDDTKEQIRLLDRDVADRDRRLKELADQDAELQRRLAAMPARASEMLTISRDYDSLNGHYNSLLNKRSEAALAANVERRELGEQFRLIDPARVPERPISPNRPVLTLIAVLAGLAVGGALVALLEYRDRSFKTDEQVTRILELPVLAVVPFMQSDAEKRRSLLFRVAVNVGCGATVAVCLAVVAYTLVR
jgi:polysaccharide chain length determinant protein (PEP-CTERM system associated)